MEITEVRIKLMEDSDDRLQAFCSITFDDCFVVRDLKIIEGSNGPFVAMPSRKLTFHCPQCGAKNHLRSAYCNHCGARLKEERLSRDTDGRTKLYADIAHPINSECREMIQNRVIAEFNEELELAKEPGYVSRYDDAYPVEFDERLEPVSNAPREGKRSGDAAGGEPQRQTEGRRDANAMSEPAGNPESTPSAGSSHPAKRTRADVQPPESGPRPPHQPKSRSATAGANRRRGRPPEKNSRDDLDDSFGAGIFD